MALGMPSQIHDVIVIGGGLAALCAAISAREHGATVQMVDRAPAYQRGGNSRHSRNLRIAHEAPSALFPGRYTVEEFMEDLRQTSQGGCDEALTRTLAEGSLELPAWLQAQGVHFERPAQGTLPWSRKTAFFLGGGRNMINALFGRAEALGVDIRQDTRVEDLVLEDRDLHEIQARQQDQPLTLRARRVIVCSGGYQADREALAAARGDAAQDFIIRGSPHVRGELLLSLLRQGAAPSGQPGACHLVAVNARSPDADGGIVTRVDGMPWGLVVDTQGHRFRDEGEIISPRRYSAWGRWVAERPDARAHLILDARGHARAPTSIYAPVVAHTLEDLAIQLGIPPQNLADTVGRYHQSIVPGGDDPETHHTQGMEPPKSRCALPLSQPPYFAHTMAPGVTFTGHGLSVDTCGHIRRSRGPTCQTLLAAGMIMSPAILGTGYVAGAALTIGAVFGRIAGATAASGCPMEQHH
ncbi:tricarballylate dehydrogenase [Ectothiorhodospira sp. BSL-9]|nr:tricarballylate dehydrogenase [Ectothiorhodospira sp. BSL-9]